MCVCVEIKDDHDFLRTIQNCFVNRPLKRELSEPCFHRMLAILSRHHSYNRVVKRSKVVGVYVSRMLGGSGRVFRVVTSYGDNIILSVCPPPS